MMKREWNNIDWYKQNSSSFITLLKYVKNLPREACLSWDIDGLDGFECPDEIPEYIILGDICFNTSDFSQDDIRTIQELELYNNIITDDKSESEHILSIPYVQRLSDGISLLMRYSPVDRVYIQGLMQPLLLKLFMSFTACKLDVTMVDPLELGFNFTDILKLAELPNFSRLSGTKIWSKEKDIENAVATLRRRLENMTPAYGGDQNSHLKEEVIRASVNGITYRDQGRYSIENGQISFSLINQQGQVDYWGQVLNNELLLSLHSHLNGHRASNERYQFVEM